MYSVNIYDQIKNLYNIYYSTDNSEFDLNQSFNENDFFNFIFPQLYNIIDLIKKKQEDQKKGKKENNDFDFDEDHDINITNQEKHNESESESESDLDSGSNNINMNINSENNINNSDESNLNYDSKKEINFSNSEFQDFYSNSNNSSRKSSNDYDHDSNLYKKEIIYPLIRKLYKRLSLICHPDKNLKYKDGVLFQKIQESYEEKMLIGMINFSLILDIELDIINLDEKCVNYLVDEMRTLINKILNKINSRV